jgi:hypothetical protein
MNALLRQRSQKVVVAACCFEIADRSQWTPTCASSQRRGRTARGQWSMVRTSHRLGACAGVKRHRPRRHLASSRFVCARRDAGDRARSSMFSRACASSGVTCGDGACVHTGAVLVDTSLRAPSIRGASQHACFVRRSTTKRSRFCSMVPFTSGGSADDTIDSPHLAARPPRDLRRPRMLLRDATRSRCG